MGSYYKLRQLFSYKVRHGLLQVATGITKCDDYYKLRQYNLQLKYTVSIPEKMSTCLIRGRTESLGNSDVSGIVYANK